MPWPVELLDICTDAAATKISGRIVYKWPYPEKNWRHNLFYLAAMTTTQTALDVFSVPESLWQEGHNRFFTWMYTETHPQAKQ